MGDIFGLLVDVYYFFLDYKFWKKKKAQRKYEKKHELPKKIMIYPSSKLNIKVFLGLSLLLTLVFFIFFRNQDHSHTKMQITKIDNLLTAEKKQFKSYPKALESIIRNNPIYKDITKDAWYNEFHYSVSEDGLNYTLVSKGKDGVLNTEDDIK